jgi:hypothetical protein
MTLEALTIRGFKCFSHAEVPLSSLTIFTGFNAGGKSTTLQSLLLLSQGLRSAPNGRFLPLNGDMVRLGTAGDVMRQGSREVVFAVNGFGSSLEWKMRAAGSKDFRTTGSSPVDEAEATFAIEDDPELVETLRRSSLQVEQVFQDGAAIFDGRPRIRPRRATRLRATLLNLIYVGATRLTRQEVFPAPDDAEPAHADVGNEGQFGPWWYVRTADNEVPAERRHPDDCSVTVRAQVDAWLNDLFPSAAANAEAIAASSYARLEFKMGRTGSWSRPSNIGYGLSYAFPVIVALLNARSTQVVIIDSPEAHLHPRAQSRMGAMLARFAAAGVQILIESHSDHVLSGVRLAVRGKTLPPDALGILFFSGNFEHSGHGIVSPSVDVEGRLSDWPEGFFDQAELDLMALAMS